MHMAVTSVSVSPLLFFLWPHLPSLVSMGASFSLFITLIYLCMCTRMRVCAYVPHGEVRGLLLPVLGLKLRLSGLVASAFHLGRCQWHLNESGGLFERPGEQLNMMGFSLTFGHSFWWFRDLV